MSIATDILQSALRGAEADLAIKESDLRGSQKAFRAAKHVRDTAAIKVTELKAAILQLGEHPDTKNA